MNRPYEYDITVEGLLSDDWTDWIAGLVVCRRAGARTTLRGTVADQSALIGVLEKLHRFNLTVVSVKRRLGQ